MSDDDLDDEPPRAWNPFTPAGVASFANAPLGHLLTVQLITALAVFLSVVFYLDRSWADAVDSAVENLPPGSLVRAGRLTIPGTNALHLATNRFVGMTFATNDAPGAVADVEIRLTADQWQISGLPGYLSLPYPASLDEPIDRASVAPKWGAWRSAVVPLSGAAITAGICLAWFALATAYAWPLRVVVFFRDKLTSRLGCWKLCAAALLPGALLMACATVFYTLGQIPAIGVAVAFVAHIVLGWTYVICGAVALPFLPDAESLRSNPFGGKEKTKTGPGRKNPFRS